MSLYAVILAGGSGKRLWPLSRAGQPKHLLRIDGQDSLLQQTARRLSRLIPAQRLFVVTHRDQAAEVARQLDSIGDFPEENILAEPEARNTLPAVLWATRRIAGENPDATVGVFPSDQSVTNEEAFRANMEAATAAAQKGFLVTFGIRPTEPSTGFGYIQSGDSLGNGVLRAKRFVEKPDRNTAQDFLSQGDYFWNAGIFVFAASVFLQEAARWQKEFGEAFGTLTGKTTAAEIANVYGALPSLSIDNGVMEKSDKVALIPADFGWNDLGNWDAFYQALDKDGNGNVLRGRVMAEETRSSLLISDHGVLATIGLDDIVVIRSGDFVLVCPRARSQEVKKIAEALPATAVTTERPWGRYTVLEEGAGYKIKRIVVDPGHKLSLQRHRQRAEHWVVIEGTAKVVNANEEILLGKNESTFIPMGQKHRLENSGEVPLVIIEVQTGNYVGEDDIERFDDIYGRTTKTDG